MTSPKESHEFDRISTSTNVSSLDHNLKHITDDSHTHMDKLDIKILQSDVRELRKSINKLDSRARLQAVVLRDVESYVKRQRMNPDTTAIIPEEISQIKEHTRKNTHRIRMIEEQMFSRNIHEPEDVNKQDNLDDMFDVKEMFMNNNFEGLKSDIPKLRQTIKFMLEHLDLQKLDEDGIQLLEELCTLSKREAVSFLRTNFWRLASLFNTLNPTFDAVLEEDNNSENGMESDDDLDTKNVDAFGLESDADGTDDKYTGINSDSETVSTVEENSSDEETESKYEDTTKDKTLGHDSEDKVEVPENDLTEINNDEETADAEFENEADYSDYQSVVP